LLYKSWQGELKATSTGSGGFSGYASVFGIRDDGGDIVQPGAFAGSIEDFLHHGFISDGHNWESVSSGAIGTIVDAKEDERGLWIQTEYHSTEAAQSARTIAQERMARGKSVALSIGYGIEPGGAEFSDDGTRHLLKLKLFEVSQVNVPMLRQAGLTGVKGFGIPFDDHSEQVRVALSEWLERARSGSDVRLKEGRPISEARRGRMATVKESLLAGVAEIEALLTETEPKAKEDAAPEPVVATAKSINPELAEAHARFLALDAWASAFDGATR
jgi:HK97 family phage prohead protease